MKVRRTLMAASRRAHASRRLMRVWRNAQAPIPDRPTAEPTDAEPQQADLLDALADLDREPGR